MNKRAIVISKGLHPPWNMGEVALARNFAYILALLYDNVSIYSTVDKMRGTLGPFGDKLELSVKYYRSDEDLRTAVMKELGRDPHVDVHFVNASLTGFLSLVRRAFLYQFAYNIFNDPKLIARSIGALSLTYLSNVRILTTAFSSYTWLRSFFRRRYYYVPAPISEPRYNKELTIDNNSSDGLKILYLGHGSYLRFPYNKVLKAILRLRKEGYNVRLNVYVSKLGYVNYESFARGLRMMIEKLGLENVVKLHVGNLSEAEKWKIIGESDVMLFPSLVNAAIDPPLVVLEAMFMGKCVVASSIQSIPYLLGEGRGIIINWHNLELGLYEALKTLYNNRALLRECGARSREWVIMHHSINVVRKIMAGIIDEP